MSGKSKRGLRKLTTQFIWDKRTLKILKGEAPLSDWEFLQLKMERERLSPLRQQFLKGPGRTIWLSIGLSVALVVLIGLLTLLLTR